jgi:hypothetical protein
VKNTLTLKIRISCLFLFLALQFWYQSNAQQEILLNEEFENNNNGWTEQNKKEARSYVRDGKYVCDVNSGAFFMDQLIPINLNTSRDFVIECTLTKKRGDASYGLSWGADGIGSRYNFMVFSKGTYSIQKWNNYDVTSYTADTPSYAIRPDYSPNKLAVKKEGSILSFYINDAFVKELAFEPFFGPKIGFYTNTGDLLVEVESLKIFYTSGSKINANQPLTCRINVFVEFFTENSKKWYETNQKDFYAKIRKGRYEINYKAAEASYNLYNSVYLDPEKDYIIETNIYKIEGNKDFGFGLTFGYKDPNNKYDFLIASNGSYKLSQWTKGICKDYCGWTASNSINKGNGINNKLAIKKEGKTLKFFINDVFVNQIPFPVYFGDRVGFVVTKNQHLEIADLQIYYVGTASY